MRKRPNRNMVGALSHCQYSQTALPKDSNGSVDVLPKWHRMALQNDNPLIINNLFQKLIFRVFRADVFSFSNTRKCRRLLS
jgi:hypothetical protein